MDTIFILNNNKQVIDILSNNGSNPSAPFFDDIYTSELDSGAERYEFTTLNNSRTNITLEVGNYVLFKYDNKYKLFQIMETQDEHSDGKKLLTCYCEMAGMELLNDYCEPFSIEGNFIAFMQRVLQDTNWAVGKYSSSLADNIQSVEIKEYENVYKLIQNNLATYGGVEIEFRVEFVGNVLVGQYIDCYAPEARGNRTYRRFEYGEDIKGITRERNIESLATAVIGIGKNNTNFKDIEWSVDNGNPCNKPLQQDFVVDIAANDLWNNNGKYIKTVYKSDTEDPATLLQESWDYLQEVKQPKFDYNIDLALVMEDYNDIRVGDTNYIVDFDYSPAILLEARVGKLELSFTNPNDNKCTLTNYKELTSMLSPYSNEVMINDMIQSHFPIQGEDIAMGAIGEGHINVTYYQAIKTDFLQASLAEVGTLIADKVDTATLNALEADILSLIATKADITSLNAATGNITNLTSQVANIQDLIAGNTTTGDLQSIHLTSSNAAIDNAVIKNAMIDTISANKINTGTINTNNVNIESEDGGINISGATQQFKDSAGTVRVQIGRDANGDFTFCLFSQDGTGILIDETGIKTGAVPNGLIVNDMVADNANISGNKIDISSVITNINNNTTSIKSSAIKFDDTGQTLQVAFNELKTKVDTIENVTIDGDLSSIIEQVTTNTTNIGVIQGQISSLITNTTVTKEDGTTVQLKDEYSNIKQTVNNHTTAIGSIETNYNKVTGDIESVTSKQASLEADLSSITSRVSQTETDLDSTKTTVAKHTTSIGNIESKLTTVENTNNSLDTRVTEVENSITKDAIVNKVSDTFAKTSDMTTLENRVSTAESKITKDAITSTVSESFYKKGETDSRYASQSSITQLSDSIATKVDKNGVISSINQSPESIRLDASKINLQGAVSAGGINEGNYVYIAKENYNVYKDNVNTMTVGTVTKDNNIVPAVFMGANGHSGGANYGALFHMGNREVLAHYNSGRNDWSEISLYSDGSIDVEPAGGLILGSGAGIGIKSHMYPHNQETIYLGYVNNPYSSMVSKEFISAFNGAKNGSVYGRDGRFYVEAGEANSLALVASDGSIDMRAKGLIALQAPNGIFLNGNVYPYNQETIYFGQTGNPISDIYSKNYNMSFGGYHHGDLYGRSGRITLEAQADHDIYLSNPNYAVKFDVNGHFMPTMYNISNLGAGAADYRWKCIYLLSNPDISSDSSLKENVRYIDKGTDISTFALNDEAKSDITTNDMYEFIRNDLRLAEYNYKGTDKNTMGFIAQDVESTKIGAKLINKNEDGTLSFDSGIRVSILEGALQKAIEKIEKLETIIDELTNNDNI